MLSFVCDIVAYFSSIELLWAAPELLARSERKTKPGDVYSYGIILAEIMTREDPYAELQMDPRGSTICIAVVLYYHFEHCIVWSMFL